MPRRTKWATSAMCTPSVHSFVASSCAIVMASSKSLASGGSIVNVNVSVRSSRSVDRLEFFLERARGLTGLVHGGLGKLGPQTVGHDDRLGLDVGAARIAQDPHDHPLGHVVLRGVMHQLDHDLVAGLGALDVRVANQHRLVERFAGGLDEPGAASLEEHAGEVLAAPLDHLDDLSDKRAPPGTGLAPPRLADDLRPHAVSGNRVAGLPPGNEQISLAARVVGYHETEAPGVEAKAPHDLLAVARQPQAALAVDLQAALLLELLDRLLKERLVLPVDAQVGGGLTGHGRPVGRVGEVIEDSSGVPKRHGATDSTGLRGARDYSDLSNKANMEGCAAAKAARSEQTACTWPYLWQSTQGSSRDMASGHGRTREIQEGVNKK